MISKTIHNEECRPVLGFERYFISESGQPYRTEPLNNKEKALIDEGALYVNKGMKHFQIRKGRMRQGYCSLTSSEGKLYNLPIAQLVAHAFGLVSGVFNTKRHSIEYIDGDKKNLHYTNLKIVDKQYGNGKLTKSDVKKIRHLISMDIPLRHIGVTFGVSEMQINRIKTGENWGNGKRKIKAPEAPFQIADGKIRKYIAIFNAEVASKELKKPFTIKRNPKDPTDNLINGILKGYKLTLKHKNITRAEVNVQKLNNYFFGS